MTICEKFKLMMASFADIKAAIIEKGGTVTGGYADYAKNIRNLYSNDIYTSQYQYPTEKPPIMQYLINLYNRITFCYAVKQEIRQAIIDGGVDVPDDTLFSEYGDKIRKIQLLEIATNFIKFRQNEKISIQLEAVGGKPPYKWKWKSYFAPNGIEFSEDGILTGIVKTGGGSAYPSNDWTVTDSTGKSVTKQITIFVVAELVHIKIIQNRFEYDGQPKKINMYCEEYPDMVIPVKYGVDNLTEAINAGTYYAQLYMPYAYEVAELSTHYLIIDPKKISFTAVENQVVTYDGQPKKYILEPSDTDATYAIYYKKYSAGDKNNIEYVVRECTQDEPTEIGKYSVIFYFYKNYRSNAYYNYGTLEIVEE